MRDVLWGFLPLDAGSDMRNPRSRVAGRGFLLFLQSEHEALPCPAPPRFLAAPPLPLPSALEPRPQLRGGLSALGPGGDSPTRQPQHAAGARPSVSDADADWK